MSLVLPLRRLASEPRPEPPSRPVPRTLHLDGTPLLEAWAARVRDAAEAMLLVDRSGRLVALSGRCAELLGLDVARAPGTLLLDLVRVVDFTAAGVPVPDPEVQLPPLRAADTGRLNRGLVRLRTGAVARSYDVVGIPLSDGAGALGFVAPV